jgi:hypothetical protein
VLTPEEHREAVRFGIHDEDVLREMAEHADDVPECARGGHPADGRVVACCCGNVVLGCNEHIEKHLIWVETLLLTVGVRCTACLQAFVFPATVDAVCRAVAL